MDLNEAARSMAINEVGDTRKLDSLAMQMISNVDAILAAHTQFEKTKKFLKTQMTRYALKNNPEDLKRPSVISDTVNSIDFLNLSDREVKDVAKRARTVHKNIKRL